MKSDGCVLSPVLRQVRETVACGVQDSSSLLQEEVQLAQAEHRLQCKERQLLSLRRSHLPAVSEELHRAKEALERVQGKETGGSPEQVEKELDEMLYQVRSTSKSIQLGQIGFLCSFSDKNNDRTKHRPSSHCCLVLY